MCQRSHNAPHGLAELGSLPSQVRRGCRIRAAPFVGAGREWNSRVLLAIRKVTTMHYFALLLGPEPTSAPDPDAQAAEMAAYQAFHAKAASAIRGRRRADPVGDRRADHRWARRADDHRRPVRRGRRGGGRLLRVRGREPRRGTGAGARHPRREVRRRRGLADGALHAAEPSRCGNNWLALLLEPPANVHHTGHPGMGRTASRSTRSSARRRAIAPTAARPCIRRPRRRRCGCATARCC